MTGCRQSGSAENAELSLALRASMYESVTLFVMRLESCKCGHEQLKLTCSSYVNGRDTDTCLVVIECSDVRLVVKRAIMHDSGEDPECRPLSNGVREHHT